MMVGLPSSSPLNQSVGTDCPELDQPQWPLLLLSFQRSASHHCTVSEAAARALKWNLISPSPSSCLSLCLYLPLAWCINPGVIFRSSGLSYWSSLSSFWAVLEFCVIANVSLDRIFLCFSRYHQDQYLWQMINKTCCFWPQVKQACRQSSLDWIRLRESCSVNNTDCTLSAGTLT